MPNDLIPDFSYDVNGASKRLGELGFKRSAQTLNRDRVDGTGPRFFRLGRRFIRYRDSDLVAWVASFYAAGTV